MVPSRDLERQERVQDWGHWLNAKEVTADLDDLRKKQVHGLGMRGRYRGVCSGAAWFQQVDMAIKVMKRTVECKHHEGPMPLDMYEARKVDSWKEFEERQAELSNRWTGGSRREIQNMRTETQTCQEYNQRVS